MRPKVEIGLTQLGTMLVVASLVAMVSRRIGLPSTAGLVLVGIGLAYVPVGADLPLSREVIFNVLLPPLIMQDMARPTAVRSAAQAIAARLAET